MFYEWVLWFDLVSYLDCFPGFCCLLVFVYWCLVCRYEFVCFILACLFWFILSCWVVLRFWLVGITVDFYLDVWFAD